MLLLLGLGMWSTRMTQHHCDDDDDDDDDAVEGVNAVDGSPIPVHVDLLVTAADNVVVVDNAPLVIHCEIEANQNVECMCLPTFHVDNVSWLIDCLAGVCRFFERKNIAKAATILFVIVMSFWRFCD